MAITVGDTDCTTGLSGSLLDELRASGSFADPGDMPDPTAAEEAQKAMAYGVAKAVAEAHNADGGGGSGDVPWSLAKKPASPDAFDEEFEGTAFSGWTQLGTFSGTAIDAFASFSTANTTRHSWNSIRESWLMMQPNTNTQSCGIYKAVTPNTNDQFWCRLSANPPGSTAQFNANIGILLGDGTSPTNYVNLYVNQGSSNPSVGFGTQAATTVDRNLNSVNGQLVEYLLLWKIGTRYHGFFAMADGSWSYLGSVTHATTFTHFQAYFRNSGAPPSNMGNPILGLDFVRRRANNATDLP